MHSDGAHGNPLALGDFSEATLQTRTGRDVRRLMEVEPIRRVVAATACLVLAAAASACQNGPTQPGGSPPGGSVQPPAPPPAPPPTPPPAPNEAPAPSISTPQPGASYTTGTAITFRGSATDPEDGELPGSSLAWSSSLDGSLGTGDSLNRDDLSVGSHTVTLRATDSEGATASISVDLTVEAPPPPSPPPPPPPPSPGFDIEIRFAGGTPSYASAFLAAAARWEEIITGDVQNVALDFDGGSCHGAVHETIDDLVIFVKVETIDGAGGALGQAGPCFIRSQNKLPITGQLTLDEDDLSEAQGLGVLEALVLHEMGHVLGFGTLWGSFELLAGAGSPDPYFTGEEAVGAFEGIGGGAYAGVPVPVENTGGTGTRDGHWRESVFDSELMTGWINVGAANPLSTVTVASLADEGYLVDASAADGFSLSLAVLIGPRSRIWVGDDVSREPVFSVDPTGRILKLER